MRRPTTPLRVTHLTLGGVTRWYRRRTLSKHGKTHALIENSEMARVGFGRSNAGDERMLEHEQRRVSRS